MTHEDEQRLAQVRERLRIARDDPHPGRTAVEEWYGIDFLLRIIDEQREELDRLPVTADGVRVIPTRDDMYHPTRGEVDPHWTTEERWLAFHVCDDRGLYPIEMSECYSTKEAAQAARGE